MIIKINGIDRQIPDGTSVNQLLAMFKIDPKGVAVDVNREVVCKSCHHDHSLKDGDVVEIVKMVGGG